VIVVDELFVGPLGLYLEKVSDRTLALPVAVQLRALLNDVIYELVVPSKAERSYDAGLPQLVVGGHCRCWLVGGGGTILDNFAKLVELRRRRREGAIVDEQAPSF
jgi:hypothetical protein